MNVAVISKIIGDARSAGRHLLEPEAYLVLKELGLTVPDHVYARSEAEVKEAAREIPKPLVMKIVSPDILHKSDVGGVELGVSSCEEALETWNRFMSIAGSLKADFRGALMVPQARPGLEMIVGAMRDEEFGPVVMVGPGGVLVEILRNPVFFTAPVDGGHVLPLLSEGVVGQLLGGFRGGRVLDKTALAAVVAAVSRLIGEFPDVAEVDLNPVVVYESGLAVLDARIMLKL